MYEDKAIITDTRLNGDDVLTFNIPHANVDITTGGRSLSTRTAEAVLCDKPDWWVE